MVWGGEQRSAGAAAPGGVRHAAPPPLLDLATRPGQPARIVPLRAEDFRPGLVAIEVQCAGPRFVTLQVDPAGADLPSLVIPLDAQGGHRYGKSVSLAGAARAAWLEVLPGNTDDVVSVAVGRPSPLTLARQGWMAARRHVREPLTLLRKIRQVLTSRSNLAFSTESGQPADHDGAYAAWQEAFDSPREIERILQALEGTLGARDVKVLAVLPPGSQAGMPSASSLRTEWHILDLRIASRPEAALTPPDAIAEAIARTGPDLVMLLDRKGELHPLAVPCLALALAADPHAVAAYGDHDVVGSDGRRREPVFKPDWSPDYHAAYDYVAQPVAFRPDTRFVDQVRQHLPPLCATYGILAGLAARAPDAGSVVHVRRPLFHRYGAMAAEAEQRQAEALALASVLPSGTRVEVSADGATRRIVRTPVTPPKVSVIIPTKDNPELLARAVRSVEQAEGIETEIIVLDNGGVTEAHVALLERLAATRAVRVVSAPGPFNFSRLINLGRAHSRHDVLLLLNDDVEAEDGSWLAELASQAARDDVGCVGALLLYPDGRVQHAGVVLGINGRPGHAFRFLPGGGPAPGQRLRVVREVAAVTAACLAVRTKVFDAVGGLDEALPVTLNDVDFCLKVRRLGYRNLFTPHARLIHRESTTRGLDATPEKLARLARETAVFQQRWGTEVMLDPFHAESLSPSHEDFRPRAM